MLASAFVRTRFLRNRSTDISYPPENTNIPDVHRSLALLAAPATVFSVPPYGPSRPSCSISGVSASRITMWKVCSCSSDSQPHTSPGRHSGKHADTSQKKIQHQPQAQGTQGAQASCVGCGWCCLDHPCDQSIHKHGYTNRCPELVWSTTDGRYYCSLVLSSATREYIVMAQRVGQGCCAPHNSWRHTVRERG